MISTACRGERDELVGETRRDEDPARVVRVQARDDEEAGPGFGRDRSGKPDQHSRNGRPARGLRELEDRDALGT